jgi:OOP family OmpA-OmpF porin
MKKGFLTLILAGSLMSAGAENALTGTKFTDNWSVGINAGVTQPLAHPYSIGENIRPQVGVELYKQFTPVFKTGVEFNAGINTTGIYGNRGVRTAFDHANLNLLGGLNLMNLFGGYKGSPRVFEIEALGGIGVGHVFGCKDADGSMAHKNYMTSKFGLNLGFNIGKAKQFTLAVKPAIVYNIEGRSQNNNAVAFNSNKANFELMAGLAYHFKTSNGTHHFTYARLYDQNEIDGLNDKINNLRGELDGKDNDLKTANNRINDLNNEVERLKNRKPNEVRVVETVTQQTRSMESVVTFRQGKSTVDNAQLPNVERVATYLNNHKDATVIIRGFASPEGSQEVNERIAKARAEAVKDILVKRYRINASRIDAQGNGVGDMFSEPDWNRVSICTIDDKEK